MADSLKLEKYLAAPVNSNVIGTFYPLTVLSVSVMGSPSAQPSIDELYHIGAVDNISITQNRTTQSIRQIEAYPNVVMGKHTNNVTLQDSYDFGFELGTTGKASFFPGEVVVIVPGGMQDLSLSLNRVDFVNSLALEAFLWMKDSDGENLTGYKESPDENYISIDKVTDVGRVVYLLLQRRPFSILEFIFDPNQGKTAPIATEGSKGGFGIAYQDCWVTSSGHSLGVQNNVTPVANMTVAVTRIRPFVFYMEST